MGRKPKKKFAKEKSAQKSHENFSSLKSYTMATAPQAAKEVGVSKL